MNCQIQLNLTGMALAFIDYQLYFIYYQLKLIIMGNLLYTIAVILVIVWAIGFLGFHAGGLIHIILVIAIIAFLLKVIGGRNSV